MNNQEILDEYFSLFELRGRSQSTIINYTYFFDEFFRYLENKNFKDITTKDIRKYLKYKKSHNQLSSIANKITVLKAFFKWLQLENYRPNNPTKVIQKPKIVDNERRFLKPKEIELIRLDNKDFMDRILFETIYSSGIRVSECMKLNWNNINFNTNELKVIEGKGNKTRLTKISIKTNILLQRYRKQREDDDKWIFQSRYTRRMSTETIERRIKNLGKRIEIEIVLTPHKLRHTFATTLSRKGVPVEIIKELMGHTDINTTMGYVDVDRGNIDYNYNQAFS